MLYDTKIPDPAAAIYHYEQYLKFDSNAPNASIVQQRIEACKQQLAADVLALPTSSATQQQLEKLIEQNRQLQDEVAKWRAYYANQLSNAATQNISTVSQTQVPIANSQIQNQQPQNNSAQTGNTTSTHLTTATKTNLKIKTHTVTSGENATEISRKYDLKLSALQSANPNVNLSKLRVGQVLNLP